MECLRRINEQTTRRDVCYHSFVAHAQVAVESLLVQVNVRY